MRTEMFLKTFVYTPFNHLTQLLAQESFIEDMLLFPICNVNLLKHFIMYSYNNMARQFLWN
jgi:hypothetical protein